MEDNRRTATLVADENRGERVDIELAEANVVWVSIESGIEVADLWIKDVVGGIDLRVRILRLGSAIEVAIDRGDQSSQWWPPDASPRMQLILDEARGTARATASVGAADGVTKVDLGSAPY